jgi:uncharacterized RDD family membrane protein YckC
MIDHKYSTFWPRFWAGIVDWIIFLPWAFLVGWILKQSHSTPLRLLCFMVDSFAFVTYSIVMHGRYGQTIGKMACKVIVLDVSESRLSMRQAILRDLFSLAFLPFSIAVALPRVLRGEDPYAVVPTVDLTMLILGSVGLILFLLEIVTMLTNHKRRSLHDFIAGSVVVRRSYTQPLTS